MKIVVVLCTWLLAAGVCVGAACTPSEAGTLRVKSEKLPSVAEQIEVPPKTLQDIPADGPEHGFADRWLFFFPGKPVPVITAFDKILALAEDPYETGNGGEVVAWLMLAKERLEAGGTDAGLPQAHRDRLADADTLLALAARRLRDGSGSLARAFPREQLHGTLWTAHQAHWEALATEQDLLLLVAKIQEQVAAIFSDCPQPLRLDASHPHRGRLVRIDTMLAMLALSTGGREAPAAHRRQDLRATMARPSVSCEGWTRHLAHLDRWLGRLSVEGLQAREDKRRRVGGPSFRRSRSSLRPR